MTRSAFKNLSSANSSSKVLVLHMQICFSLELMSFGRWNKMTMPCLSGRREIHNCMLSFLPCQTKAVLPPDRAGLLDSYSDTLNPTSSASMSCVSCFPYAFFK